MNEKSEAMRLADEFDGMTINEFYEALGDEAAAELRRLHAECEHHKAWVAHITAENKSLEAQRDALLEALKRAADFLHHATEFRFGHPGFEQTHAKARAAIKAVEDGK